MAIRDRDRGQAAGAEARCGQGARFSRGEGSGAQRPGCKARQSRKCEAARARGEKGPDLRLRRT